ncbi:hypothetical protein AZG88_09055 [Rhodococcus sp. LB1]|nr:hypothetical protein AZG88_09055 [Rhodococcus sp. LB1]
MAELRFSNSLDTLSARDMIEALIAGERDPRRLGHADDRVPTQPPQEHPFRVNDAAEPLLPQ